MNGRVRRLDANRNRRSGIVSTAVALEQVIGGSGIAQVRELMLEYRAGLNIDLSFQRFDEELAGLPGDYAPPHGRLYLAWIDERAAGCAALRPLDANTAEMKRLYVREGHRRGGVARQLAQQLIEDARSIGYTRLVLDTLPAMHEAQRLYAALGFVDIAAYTDNPIAGARFLGLAL